LIVGIDGDVLRYELGAVAIEKEEVFGMTFEKPWPDNKVHALVDDRVKSIIEACGANEYELYLTGDGNFRFEIATIAPYKGQRSGDKPYHWRTVGDRLKSHWGAKTVLGIEADDILAMRGTTEAVYAIASRDKDLRQVPCFHYSWKCGENQPERPLYKVDYLGEVDFEVKVSPKGDKSYKLVGHGLRFFYGQMLTGDGVDNIKGCPRIGPKIASDELKFLTTEKELFTAVARKYQLVYGDDWKKYLEENARLLYLIRDYDWVTIEDLGDNSIKYSIKKLWETPYDLEHNDTGREEG
jgi:hypothetical protein